MTTAPRHPLIAVGLSLLAPGLGLLYVGRAPLAFVALLSWFAGSALAQWAAMQQAPGLLPHARVAVSLFVLLAGAVAAAVLSRRPTAPKGYQHWWWLFGFGFLSWAATMQVQNRVIAPRVGFALRAPNDHMAPALPARSIVVVDPNGRAQLDDVVLLRTSERVALARVLAIPGQAAQVVGGQLMIDGVAHNTKAQTGAGVGCDSAITSVSAGQRFVLPDARSAESCAAVPRLINTSDVIGVVVSP